MERLVEQYGTLVVRQAYFYLKDRHKAEDIAQEVFLRVYKKQPDLPDEQSWIFDMINNILIEVLSSIAEQERLTIRQRQREGIEAAKLKGKHLGRRPTLYPQNWNELYTLWLKGDITAKEFMRRTGLKKSTFYRMIHTFGKH